MSTDILSVFQWWSVFLIIGLIFLPITNYFFGNFFDRGYIFSKILGIGILTYIIFLLGSFHLAPFTQLNSIIVLALITILIAAYYLHKNDFPTLQKKFFVFFKKHAFIFLFEELLFLVALSFWAWIRGFAPDIHGLEKFMDFGFINSILRSDYFPPKDMWFTPLPINYYYFGHIVTAVLTRLSFLNAAITYNLMLATIFALTFTASFSIGANLIYLKSQNSNRKNTSQKSKINKFLLEIGNWKLEILGGGLLTAILITFGGNLHTIYTLFVPYQNENPVPFWQLTFSPQTFPNSYWYPNATRFIHNTIHEFPLYSFVVSDLHGHVLDIPFVLLAIALLLSFFTKAHTKIRNWSASWRMEIKNLTLFSFILAVMYMTNAWDGAIYLLLSIFVLFIVSFNNHQEKFGRKVIRIFLYTASIGIIFFVVTFPFARNFQTTSIVHGIGVVCAPDFLTKLGNLGPLLFEKDHCLRSPLWQLFILYGFFYFWVIIFIFFILKKSRKIMTTDIFIFILISLSTLLIIIPEFFYMKDIYPAHYRANTMFKLVYQSFMMLSICSVYIIFRIIGSIKIDIQSLKRSDLYFFFLSPVAFVFLSLIFIYPYFAITSYYGNLQTYHGLDGLKYLQPLYPTDYDAILWIQKNVTGQPIILEAQGDSYTDYARVSANTGLPTVLGWTVHEWLWRGTYDIPAPRIEEIKNLYESKDINKTRQLIQRYNISLVFVGALEKQKYTELNEEKFKKLGTPLYHDGQTTIYRVSR